MSKTMVARSSFGSLSVCESCHRPIGETVVHAMNTTWHPDHFRCHHCDQPISSAHYYMHNGFPYCVDDYRQLFIRDCNVCGNPCNDVVYMALGRPWCRSHFACNGCGDLLANRGFYECASMPYCGDCYQDLHCPMCAGCNTAIVDTAVTVLGSSYHPGCFTCDRCRNPLLDCTFTIQDSQPVCSNCDWCC